MGDRLRWLERVATAMADGEAVDWPEVVRRFGDAAGSRRAAALRLVDRVQSQQGRASGVSRGAVGGPALPVVAHAVALLSIIQLSAALVAPGAWTDVRHPLPPAFVLGIAVPFGLVGLALIAASKRDRRAEYLGGFFLAVASGLALRFQPVSAPWPVFAMPARWLRSLAPDAFLPFYLWGFVARFPRLVRFERVGSLANVMAKVSALLGVLLFAANAVDAQFPLGASALVEAFRRAPRSAYWVVVVVLALPTPIVALLRSRLADGDERSRVHWLLGSLALSAVPLLLAVLAEALFPRFAAWVALPRVRLVSGIVLFSLLLVFPLVSAYAVLVHRILRVRFLLRRTVAFGLARATVTALVVLPTAGLLSHLTASRQLPLEILLLHGSVPVWLAAALGGWVLLTVRGALLRHLESWLVGRRGDVATLLASFGREAGLVSTAADLDRLLDETARRLLSASGAFLLMKEVEAGPLLALRGDVPALGPRSGIPRLASAAGTPLVVAAQTGSSLIDLLGTEDRAWVSVTRACVVIGLQGNGLAKGLLVVRDSVGGSPFRTSDLRIVEVLAATCILRLERLTRGEPIQDAQVAGQCVACGRAGPLPDRLCRCGGELESAVIPFELAGKFRLQGLLGRGGMGVVYRAEDLVLGRHVALKTLPRVRGAALERLRREARSMAGFVHPNLAVIFGIETWQSIPVLVVEYLPGGTLAERLPLPPRAAVELVAELSGALAAMHAEGLTHRDVKPQNIAFATDGTPKLLDFGLAQLTAGTDRETSAMERATAAGDEERLTSTDGVVGTLLYLSPEAVVSRPPTPSQDLWALHLVLWEVIAGQHPLEGLSTRAVVDRIRSADLPFSSLDEATVPGHLIALLREGLAADPRLRPSSAGECRRRFVAALDRL